MLLSTGGYGASGFNNDADGNTLMGNGRTNAWDSQNRLVSCLINGTTTAYKYGADGLRRQSTKNGVSTDYANDATMVVREGHAQTVGGVSSLQPNVAGQPASVTATYLIGPQGPSYRRDDTAFETDSQQQRVTKARWYFFDGLGSVAGEVDPLGNLTSSPKYDVYGAGRANPGTAMSKQGFVGNLGHISDDTGLVYMWARYYDSSAGRFASEDPGENGNNWLTYCENNPVNHSDETGKYPNGLNQKQWDYWTSGSFGTLVAIGECATSWGLRRLRHTHHRQSRSKSNGDNRAKCPNRGHCRKRNIKHVKDSLSRDSMRVRCVDASAWMLQRLTAFSLSRPFLSS
jgi:RHS repeat-associated protein